MVALQLGFPLDAFLQDVLDEVGRPVEGGLPRKETRHRVEALQGTTNEHAQTLFTSSSLALGRRGEKSPPSPPLHNYLSQIQSKVTTVYVPCLCRLPSSAMRRTTRISRPGDAEGRTNVNPATREIGSTATARRGRGHSSRPPRECHGASPPGITY